jgi:hypothetical protein
MKAKKRLSSLPELDTACLKDDPSLRILISKSKEELFWSLEIQNLSGELFMLGMTFPSKRAALEAALDGLQKGTTPLLSPSRLH